MATATINLPAGSPGSPSALRPAVLPLQTGDKLTRDEFERRYQAMPTETHAELIEGLVYLPSPVRYRSHGSPHLDLILWGGTYKMATPGIGAADNATVRLDLDNEPQPDVTLIIAPGNGGQTRISKDDYLEGAPEFVGEVSASSASIDLHAKFHAYRRNGVREYLVWRVYDAAVDWFILRGSEYERLETSDGIFRSEVLPGLWLDAAALSRQDMRAVLQALQQGVTSPQHGEFVIQLQARAPVPRSLDGGVS